MLRFVYINSFFQAGIKSPLDDAVLKHERPKIGEYEKVDEIPFDFNRKRLSVVVRHGDELLLVTKGEAENVFAICHRDRHRDCRSRSMMPSAPKRRRHPKLSADGYRTLGVAVPEVDKTERLYDAEHDMTLEGFAAFLDPPKKGIGAVLDALKQNGVSVVIMTGDNQFVTQKVARDVGIAAELVLTGTQLDAMDDAALAYQAEKGAIFARVAPAQKNRVILALKARDTCRLHGRRHQRRAFAAHGRRRHLGRQRRRGREGRGEDHPAGEGSRRPERRHHRGPAQFRQHHEVHRDGDELELRQHVQHGGGVALSCRSCRCCRRRSCSTTSSTTSRRSAFPPTTSTPRSSTGQAMADRAFIRQFMMIIGPISSLYDFLTFGLLFWVFHAAANPSLFHTGLVRGIAGDADARRVRHPDRWQPFQEPPEPAATHFCVTCRHDRTVLPYSPLGPRWVHSAAAALLASISFLAVTYLLLVQAVKTWFYRRHALL